MLRDPGYKDLTMLLDFWVLPTTVPMAAGWFNCRRFLDEMAALCSTTRRSDLIYEMADPVLSK